MTRLPERMYTMKKLLCAVLALMMILSLCACGKEEPAETAAVGTLPVPFDDPGALEEAMVPTAFDAADLEIAEDGTMSLTADIYVQVMYDAVEISELKKGDRFFDAEGNEMTVESVEFTDTFVQVNGGMEKGGVSLISMGGGTYMQAQPDGFVAIFNCGEATYPVNPEFTLLDNADPENPGVTVSAEELSAYLEADTIGFTPYGTTLVIENCQIVQIIRNALPE